MGRHRGSAVAFALAYVVLVVGLFLALGGAAYAQTPASDQYDSKVENVTVSEVVQGDTQGATAGEAQALPNTGLSLLGVAVVGAALVGAGVLLRRRERDKS